jgi:phenylacetate-coenzyme A ligase PaaK-like adenylate-forming protein
MNDLLELSDEPCPCGSAFQPVKRVHGRTDDLFEFACGDRRIIATPDVLRNAVVDAHPAITDFRIVQKRDGRVVVTLDGGLPDEAHDAARNGLRAALLRLGADPGVESARGIAPRMDRKLRRVERELG